MPFVGKSLLIVPLISLLFCIQKPVFCGWGSFTYTEVTETIAIKDMSIQKTYTYADTSQTDYAINVNMTYVHSDLMFHDLYWENSNGRKGSKPEKANEAIFTIRYTLTKRYQQFWLRFSYTIDDAVQFGNGVYTLEITPKWTWSENATVDQYALCVQIPLYVGYFMRISAVNLTREPNEVLEEGGFRMMKWRMTGRQFGARIKTSYNYGLDVREMQGMIIGGLVGAMVGALVDRLILVVRGRHETTSLSRKGTRKKRTDAPVSIMCDLSAETLR